MYTSCACCNRRPIDGRLPYRDVMMALSGTGSVEVEEISEEKQNNKMVPNLFRRLKWLVVPLPIDLNLN